MTFRILTNPKDDNAVVETDTVYEFATALQLLGIATVEQAVMARLHAQDLRQRP